MFGKPKEIIFKFNNDGSYEMIAKHDIYDSSNKKLLLGQIINMYPSVSIGLSDIKVLSKNDVYGYITLDGDEVCE